MVTAYIDESGISDRDEFSFVGGFIAEDSVWRSFSAAWFGRLSRSGLKYFHMAEFKADMPPFCPPILNRAAHKNLEYELMNIIRDHEIYGCVVRIHRFAWDRIITGYKSDFIGSALKYAFSEIAFEFHDLRDRMWPEKRLDIVYGEGPFSKEMQTIKSVYDRSAIDMPDKFGGISSAPMKSNAGIQASDVLVWEVMSASKESVKMNSDTPASKNLQKIGVRSFAKYINEPEIWSVYHSVYLSGHKD